MSIYFLIFLFLSSLNAVHLRSHSFAYLNAQEPLNFESQYTPQNYDIQNPQPIIINGGNMPALHIFHQAAWVPTIVKNTVEDFRVISDLQKISKKIDMQLAQRFSQHYLPEDKQEQLVKPTKAEMKSKNFDALAHLQNQVAQIQNEDGSDIQEQQNEHVQNDDHILTPEQMGFIADQLHHENEMKSHVQDINQNIQQDHQVDAIDKSSGQGSAIIDNQYDNQIQQHQAQAQAPFEDVSDVHAKIVEQAKEAALASGATEEMAQMVADKLAQELAESLEKSTIPHWMMDLTGQRVQTHQMLNENNEIGFSGAQAIETKGHSNIGGDGNGRLGQSLGIGQPQTITMQQATAEIKGKMFTHDVTIHNHDDKMVVKMENNKLEKPIEALRFKQQPVQNITSNSTRLDQQQLIDKLQIMSVDKENPICLYKEGMIKVREQDDKLNEVPLTFAILSKDRLSYFLDKNDESSIQGSIQLNQIETPIQIIAAFASCFQIISHNSSQNSVVCVESEKKAVEWIDAITQNIVNCN